MFLMTSQFFVNRTTILVNVAVDLMLSFTVILSSLSLSF